MSEKPEMCRECGHNRALKRGWTNARYCSERCERDAVNSLHRSMPGIGPSKSKNWIPHHISVEIANRWRTVT